MTKRALAAYSISGTFVSTTLDHLKSLKRFDGLEVEYVNVTVDSRVVAHPSTYDVVFYSYCGFDPTNMFPKAIATNSVSVAFV